MKNFLKELAEQDIFISLDGENLKLKFREEIQAAVLEDIKKNKEKLISYLKKEESKTKPGLIPLAESKENAYPLSSSQKRFWLLSQIKEASIAYNVPNQTIIEEKLEPGSFEQAIEKVIQRHEILRTVFIQDESGEPLQKVLSTKQLNFKLDFRDLRALKEQEAYCRKYIQEDTLKAFNLERGPLFRIILFQLAEKKFVFHYNFHHIIIDILALKVFTEEVQAFYQGILIGREPALPNLRIQYKDYAVWQQQQLKEGALKEHEAFCLDYLEDIKTIDLPTSKTRPPVRTNRGRLLSTYIPQEQFSQLKKFCQQQGGTAFIGLTAVFNILLNRYTGLEDIAVATPVSGRDRSDLKDLMGSFVNTIVLRSHFSPAESFTEVFQKVKEASIAAYAHQAYPLDEILNKMDQAVDMSRNPLFDIIITYENIWEGREPVLSEEETRKIEDKGELMSKVDIEITLQEQGGQLLFSIGYNRDVYEKGMIEQFMRHFKSLLAALLVAPSSPITRLKVLSEEEQERQLKIARAATKQEAAEGTFLELFKEHVQQQPDAPALVFDSTIYSYAELDAISNQLAHYLQEEQQISTGAQVAVHLDHSDQLVIALLGILKSGGTYVPLDPKVPRERKETILKEAEVKLLLTDTNYMFDLDFYEGNLFSIDVEFEPGSYSSEVLEEGPDTTDLAYIIYTSGSTGIPKGVMIEHGALRNYLYWGRSYYADTNPSLDFALYTTISFDLTISSLFLPLVSGGKLEVYSSDASPAALLERYFREGLSCIKLTPAHINLLKELDLKSTTVNCAIVGGDVLHHSQVETLLRLNPEMRIYNEYGPTEATVGCIVYEVSKDAPILIGKAISNTSAYILGSDQELLPLGVWGEIYIGGSGLARGYHHQADLSATSFIMNPYNKGERLYRTGDIGRYLDDGNMEYGGRIDDQVKIRGYRIELGEVVSCLNEQEGVEAAHVEVREDSLGEKQIVAYLLAKESLSSTELAEGLKKKLPEYMLPNHYVQLEEFPLTRNGKISRAELPSPEGLSLNSGTAYVAPRNEVEEQLVIIWSEVLGKEPIGIQDNFFELGGHSLKAVQLISRISKKFSVKINPVELFENPNIEKLSEEIEKIQWANNQLPQVENNNNIESFSL
jgi:amino acid adenylation domain-containing protein